MPIYIAVSFIMIWLCRPPCGLLNRIANPSSVHFAPHNEYIITYAAWYRITNQICLTTRLLAHCSLCNSHVIHAVHEVWRCHRPTCTVITSFRQWCYGIYIHWSFAHQCWCKWYVDCRRYHTFATMNNLVECYRDLRITNYWLSCTEEN